jgi:hypothetical protein
MPPNHAIQRELRRSDEIPRLARIPERFAGKMESTWLVNPARSGRSFECIEAELLPDTGCGLQYSPRNDDKAKLRMQSLSWIYLGSRPSSTFFCVPELALIYGWSMHIAIFEPAPEDPFAC